MCDYVLRSRITDCSLADNKKQFFSADENEMEKLSTNKWTAWMGALVECHAKAQ